MSEKDVVKKKDRDNILRMPDDEVIDLVKGDFTISENARQGPNNRNQRYRKIYFQKEDVTPTDKKTHPQSDTSKRARNYVPVGRAIVDTARSMIAQSMFSQDPPVQIQPAELEDEEHSEAFQSLFSFRAGRSQMNLKAKFKDDFLFQACLYDFVVGRVGWVVKRAYVPYVRKEDILTKLAFWRWPRQKISVDMIPKLDAIDRPDFEVLNTLLCYPDARATDFDNSRHFIYVQDTNLSEMRKREKTTDNPFGIYTNVNKVEPNKYPGLKAIQETQGKDDYVKQAESDLVQLMNYYTPDAVVQIANGKVVVRKKPMPGYPFTKGAYCQPNHQWSGVGLMEGIEMLQIDINQLIRLRRDNINYIVNAIAVINKGLFGMLSKKDWRMWPGRTFQINQGDATKAIFFARPPDTTQTILQDVNFDLHMTERTSGVSENRQSVYRQGRRTATEAGLVSEGSDTRLGEIASAFEDKNLVDVVYMGYNLELQFLTEAAKYRILGKAGYEFKKVGRMDILHQGAFDVRPIGTKFFGNKQLKDNQFLQAAGIAAGNPLFAQMTEASAVLKEMWSRSGVKDPERFIRDLSATGYKIPVEIENEIILATGHDLEPGDFDDDAEHIASHTEFMQNGDYSPENAIFFQRHIAKHTQRQQMLKSGGQQTLPQEGANILGQPYQQFGGYRVPGGGEETPASVGAGGLPSPESV